MDNVKSNSWSGWVSAIPFVIIHLLPLGLLWTGVSLTGVIVCWVVYRVRMWGITAGYHRYFSHRSFKTSRVMQFILAFISQTSAQRGVLWWAAGHRRHHKYSDQEGDIHSPVKDGFWYSHVGWIFAPNAGHVDYERIKDFAKYPELRFLDKFYLLPPAMLGVAIMLIWGPSVFFLGFCVSTILLWHTTFLINSLAHVVGKRRFKTTDASRNNWFLGIICMGEGWHNNHHHYQTSCRQGFYWWEIDVTFYVLKAMSWVGLVWDLKSPTDRALAHNRIDGKEVIDAPVAGGSALKAPAMRLPD